MHVSIHTYFRSPSLRCPEEVKSLAQQPLNISVTGSLEGHDRQADVWGARYSLSILILGCVPNGKENVLILVGWADVAAVAWGPT